MIRRLAPALILLTASAFAQPPARLKIYFIDVEGGQATLFVTPTNQSLLVDTGWPGHEGRDATRIADAAKDAGITHIDNVLITHYHDDHVGGVPQLVTRIPVGRFIDHGPNRELDGGITEHGYAAYQEILTKTDGAGGRFEHLTVKPGDVLPLSGVRATVISSDGNSLTQPLPGAGQPNPFCAASETRPPDQTENARSLGIELTFGTLKILDLGDLTWDKEVQLMCPGNKLGAIDILIVSHHGFSQSSSPALVEAIHPRVAIMDNGAKKGGSTPTFETLAKSPGLETLWQLHYSDELGAAKNTTAHNMDAQYIANPPGPDAGNYLKLTATPDGSFEVLNSRTEATKTYAAAGTGSIRPSSTK